ncbi:glutaredoxin family protein [Brevundimonas sp. UBA5936]|nr:glutaredoxin family protein [Brevundimonas sp. UBA5936]
MTLSALEVARWTYRHLEGLMMTASTPVLIYTTPTCPDCHALKRWLAEQGVEYEERDLTDPRIADEAKARTGVRVAPISIVGDAIFYGTFQSQKPGLMQALGLTQVRQDG